MIVLLAAAWAPLLMGQVPTDTPEPTDMAPRFGIYPVGEYENRYFEVEIEAGGSMQLTSGVVNAGEVDITVRVYATNAFNPPNGGFAAGSDEDVPTGATLWLDFASQQFSLKPGETREQTFTVTVPEGTPAGQYIAALVVQTDGAVEIPGNDMFQQIIRGAMSVEITVPGKSDPSFDVLAPEFPADSAVAMLSVPVSNTGNVLVKPAGEVIVTTADGVDVLTSTVEMGSVYAGHTVPLQVMLPDQLPYGDYAVSVQLTDANSNASAAVTGVPAEYRRLVAEDAPTLALSDIAMESQGDPIRFVDISGSAVNNGSTIPAANLVLEVQRDGRDVESYPLAKNMVLPEGSTSIDERYVPLEEWEKGTYTFRIVVSAVDPSGGQTTILLDEDLDAEIVVP